MKASPMMKTVVQQLAAHHKLDLTHIGEFLRLDMPGHDSLVIEVVGPSQIAVTVCFEEGNEWKIDQAIIFLINAQNDWLAIEITHLRTGWYAAAKLAVDGQQIVRVNHCGQEWLADYADRWAEQLEQQNWLDQGEVYQPWTPPWRKE